MRTVMVVYGAPDVPSECIKQVANLLTVCTARKSYVVPQVVQHNNTEFHVVPHEVTEDGLSRSDLYAISDLNWQITHGGGINFHDHTRLAIGNTVVDVANGIFRPSDNMELDIQYVTLV